MSPIPRPSCVPKYRTMPRALGDDQVERLVELLAAVAAGAPEDVAGHAARVRAHEHGVARADLAVYEREVRVAGDQVLVDVGLPVDALDGQHAVGALADEPLGQPAVCREVLDADHVQAVLGGEALEVGPPRHRAVVVHDLADHGRRLQAGHPREVDGAFGVTVALEHAALGGAQRERVARACEVARLGVRVDQVAHGGGAVVGRDAGRRQVLGLDRDGEGGRVRARVARDGGLDPELVQPLAGHRGADEPAGLARHEGDVLGRDELGGDAEVALVLAVRVVDEEHELAAGEVGDGVGNGGQPHEGPRRRRGADQPRAAGRTRNMHGTLDAGVKSTRLVHWARDHALLLGGGAVPRNGGACCLLWTT